MTTYKYKTLDPEAEIIGSSILSHVNCSKKDSLVPFLEKHGFETINPHEWYPVQRWLDVLNDVADEHAGLEATFDFVSIGIEAATAVTYPPQVLEASLEQVLMMSNQGYQMNHRGGDVGEYVAEKIAPNHIKLSIRSPYPSDLLYGLTYGQARRFLPAGSAINVIYDPDEPKPEDGGTHTVLHVKWH